MYNAAALQAKFLGLVGFLQYSDPSYPSLPSALLQSTSKRYIQNIHPLCQLETVWNCAPEFTGFQYSAWVAQAYKAGTVVNNAGTLYVANSDTVAGDVPGVSVKWETVEPFGAWLQNLYNHSILEAIGDFIRVRALEYSNRTILDSQILFDGIGLYSDRIIKTGRFVGLAFRLSAQNGLQVAIEQIGAQLDAAQDLTLYLYHSSVQDPILSFDISVAKASTFNWQNPEIETILKFYDQGHNTGGLFYLGYYEDDLVGQAIKMTYNFATGPCSSCNAYNLDAFNRWSKFVQISPFSVPATALDAGRLLFNTDKVQYGDEGNYGINVALTVACDMTEFFGLHRNQFAQALGMKIALKLLEVIAYSTRMTAVEDKVKALAFSDLSEKEQDSFYNRYQRELTALTVDFSGFSSQCMPCATKSKRITMGAV